MIVYTQGMAKIFTWVHDTKNMVIFEKKNFINISIQIC